jgi:hypothetical protein
VNIQRSFEVFQQLEAAGHPKYQVQIRIIFEFASQCPGLLFQQSC